jgi:GH25 family lysozyme M1 (1,4-beta-N-acetylmuramidase)
MQLKGIDVSYAQGNINWDKVKASGIDFAILRCGYGQDVKSQDDKFFERNAKACEELNIPYGVYLYSYATSEEGAIGEANHTLRLLKGKKLSYPVFYDLEDTNTTGQCSNSEILKIAKAYVSALEKEGYKVGIYANKHWFTSKLTQKWYDKYPKWVAQYNKECTYKGTYDMWQYTSSGRVSGIIGNVDMNYCYKDYAPKKEEEKPVQKKPTTTKKPAPEKKSVDEVAKEVLEGKWGNGEVRKKKLKAAGYDYDKVQEKVNDLIYTKGRKVILTNASLYKNSETKKATKKVSGEYYIYDGEKINGRYRITNKEKNCGKKPIWLYVTGFIEI